MRPIVTGSVTLLLHLRSDPVKSNIFRNLEGPGEDVIWQPDAKSAIGWGEMALDLAA
jgi:hypothetical protein